MFWDRDLKGFGLRVHASGRQVFVVQTPGPNGPKRATLERYGILSQEQARKQALGSSTASSGGWRRARRLSLPN